MPLSHTSNLFGRVLDQSDLEEEGLELFHIDNCHSLEEGKIYNASEKQDRPHSVYFTQNPMYTEFNYVVRREVERVFEMIRREHYPSLPSRETCLFCSLDKKDVESWKLKGSRADGRTVRVQPLEETKVTVLEYAWYDYAVHIQENQWPGEPVFYNTPTKEGQIEKAAHAYWMGDASTGIAPRIEVLVEGLFEVTEFLS